MPQQAWSDKRERQYEHIHDGLKEHGRSEKEAKEIAARTVNKERARSGESDQSSRTSTSDLSSGRRGGCGRIAARTDQRMTSSTTKRVSATSRVGRA